MLYLDSNEIETGPQREWAISNKTAIMKFKETVEKLYMEISCILLFAFKV